jgi:uncharacterized membrane protein YccF (DUF307 family)
VSEGELMIRFIGNVIWLLLAGLPLALSYAAFGFVAFILIITIPFGIASFRLAGYALWPFGRTVVRRPDAGAGSAIGNLIWFLVAGLWLALAQVVIGIVLCLTIIGIPFGIACFKMARLALFPLGKEIVDADHPDAAVSGIHAVTPVGH